MRRGGGGWRGDGTGGSWSSPDGRSAGDGESAGGDAARMGGAFTLAGDDFAPPSDCADCPVFLGGGAPGVTRQPDGSDAVESGAIVPGDPQKSEIIARINHTDPDELMPPPKSQNQRQLRMRYSSKG